MAWYVYLCKKCSHEFPVNHPMSQLDSISPKCTKCGEPTKTRVLQSVPQVGERFKGNGGQGSKGFTK